MRQSSSVSRLVHMLCWLVLEDTRSHAIIAAYRSGDRDKERLAIAVDAEQDGPVLPARLRPLVGQIGRLRELAIIGRDDYVSRSETALGSRAAGFDIPDHQA